MEWGLRNSAVKRNVCIELRFLVSVSPCLWNVRFLCSAHALSTHLFTVVPLTHFTAHTLRYFVPILCQYRTIGIISRLVIFFLVSHYIPQQPKIILMPCTLDFPHCYLMLNGYFSLFLHLITSVRVSAVLLAALLLFKSFCPLFPFEHFSKKKHMFGSPPSFITSKFLLLSKLFHFPLSLYSHYCKDPYPLVFHLAVT
jgi:hypothetical protein